MAKPSRPDLSTRMNRPDLSAGRRIALHGRALLACDDHGDLETLAKLLENQGLEVHIARDGDHTLELLKSWDFDLVFLGSEGFTTLQKIKEHPRTNPIPVLITASADQLDEAARCIEAGAEDYLSKPFHAVLLRARVMACLEKKALGEAGLRHLQAVEETQRRLQGELSEAARYVRSILPEPIEHPFKIDWKYSPSSELGGDAFGYHSIDEEHFAVYLLDVCGHGVAASLLSVTAINLIRSGALPNTDFRDPSAVLAALNLAFPMERQNGMYFTIWYGVYHSPSRTLRHGSGGHPPALLISGSESSRLHAPGMIIGAMADSRFETQTCPVPEGATLLVLCDGCFEIQNPGGGVVAFEEFEIFMRQNGQEPNGLGKLFAWVKKRQGGGRLMDDFSIVRIQF
ncbi:MAG: PP2C family protein-serine/threonine phosphatase [Terrimicrobiaceae bacterium]